MWDIDSFFDQGFYFVLVFVGLLFVLVPFALWLTYRHRAKVFPRSIAFEELPEQVQKFMQPRVEAIALWGFDLVAYLNLGPLSAGTESFMALLSNPHTSEWADVSFVVSPRKSRGYMEFTTHCSEEVQVDTNTNPIPPALFRTPNSHVFHFPQVDDVFTLYRLHRKLVDLSTNGNRPILPSRGQEVAELQRRLERFGPWQQSRGYMYLQPPGKFYRLTLKGAIVGGWRAIWPVARMRSFWSRRKSEAILRKIGLADQPRESA